MWANTGGRQKQDTLPNAGAYGEGYLSIGSVFLFQELVCCMLLFCTTAKSLIEVDCCIDGVHAIADLAHLGTEQ